jgi:hypothetical protein
MQVAIDETDRRRGIQEAYNREHGITPTTIVKEIRDINDRLRAVAEAPGAYGDGGRQLSEMSQAQVEKLLGQLEAEMRSAAKQLEFERAAALRDEIADIRLRVLEQDASVAVLKAAERAASRSDAPPLPRTPTAKPTQRAAARRSGERRGRHDDAQESALEVVAVTVLPADAEPLEGIEQGTASDVFPGIRDAHEGDDEGWMARWLDRPTWDRRVTPNVIKRTGTRRPRRR